MTDCCGINDPCLTRGGKQVCPICEKAPPADLDAKVEEARREFDNAVTARDVTDPRTVIRVRNAWAALEAAITQRAAHRLTQEHAQMRALLMTLMDVAQEASGYNQSYDFRPRAATAANAARAFLASWEAR